MLAMAQKNQPSFATQVCVVGLFYHCGADCIQAGHIGIDLFYPGIDNGSLRRTVLLKQTPVQAVMDPAVEGPQGCRFAEQWLGHQQPPLLQVQLAKLPKGLAVVGEFGNQAIEERVGFLHFGKPTVATRQAKPHRRMPCSSSQR